MCVYKYTSVMYVYIYIHNIIEIEFKKNIKTKKQKTFATQTSRDLHLW